MRLWSALFFSLSIFEWITLGAITASKRASFWSARSKFCAHQVSCPDPTLPRCTDLFRSPIDTELPPLIYHVQVERQCESLLKYVSSEIKIPLSLVEQLTIFGGVYYSDTSKGKRDGSTAAKRITKDQPCNKGAYCRIHVNPRRYPLAWDMDWSSCILSSSSLGASDMMETSVKSNFGIEILLEISSFLQQFLVVNKPNGVPSVATVDNMQENVVYQVERALKLGRVELTEPIQSTSRLDTCTSGLLVLARTSLGASVYHKMLRENSITKIYRVLTEKPLPLGTIRHLFPSHSGAEETGTKHRNSKPTLLSSFNESMLGSDWKLAECIVLSSTLLQVCPRENYLMSLSSPRAHTFYESEIQLVTGRTHQLRLQSAALGAAIVGDTRYSPVEGQLNSVYDDGSGLFGREPRCIGLHCDRVSFPLPFYIQRMLEKKLIHNFARGELESIWQLDKHIAVNLGSRTIHITCSEPPWR